jgi:ABC-2 type transport system permease protein
MSGRVMSLLVVVGAALAAAAAFGALDPGLSNGLLFGAWLAALLLLFGLGLRLPSQTRRSIWPAPVRSSAIVLAAIAIAVIANVGIYLHDVHFDLTAERRYTPPPQAKAVVAALARPMTITYFYNPADGEALEARRLLEILAHGAPLLRVDPVELDRRPELARRYQVSAYNTAVIETEGRTIKVERTTDLAQIGLAALRALRRQTPVVCFVTGHGEFAGGPGLTPPHYAHQETLDAHQGYGTEDRLVAAPTGLDRLYLALEQQGYEVREIALATLEGVPEDCAAVADFGPRHAYAANEADLLRRYLGRGGGLLLAYDPESVLGPETSALLGQLGVDTAEARVIDPLDHYGTDPEFVAVPSYTSHPITEGIALTFFPGARPLYVGTPPTSIALFPLFGSSKDSRARLLALPSAAAAEGAPIRTEVSTGAPGAAAPISDSGPQTLALALNGSWLDAAAGTTPFRAVVVGDSDFVTNAYFDQVANGELGVAMIRWLARDDALPSVRPERSTPPMVTMTAQEMRWTFITLEVLLPLGVVLIGSAVWWRRR